ncbi:MAG: SGNH/GDSL hydrolase family protein [Bacteroidales bacterium]|nr:SGNH/GDSL hydrolase family protein [Bacteroidales bacterium]
MKNKFGPYFGFWMLLVAAFAVFTCVSAFGPVKVGRYEMKSSGIWQTLTKAKSSSAPALTNADVKGTAQKAEAPAASKPVETDTVPKTILFIGDSMLDGLSPRLAAYAKENGHTLYTVVWYSSTSEFWGNSSKLREYLKKINPDYVFISLGANEMFVKDIAEKRDKYVKNIIRDLGSIPYVWIGPPNWKEDTGINDLVAANVGADHFFKTKGMKFPRMKDGAHPTHEAAIGWMDSIARWMPAHSSHPIKMKTPTVKTARPKRVFVHQPSEY